MVSYPVPTNYALQVVTYNPIWPIDFENERDLIDSVCGKFLSVIEHIGSTAVINLAAKPILDIMPGLKVGVINNEFTDVMESIGYIYQGNYHIKNRMYFTKDKNEKRFAQVHCFIVGQGQWNKHILFRDYLRKDESIRIEYAKLKQNLAHKFQFDRDEYTKAKDEFIVEIINQALKETNY